jgi:hypothetical protein
MQAGFTVILELSLPVQFLWPQHQGGWTQVFGMKDGNTIAVL